MYVSFRLSVYVFRVYLADPGQVDTTGVPPTTSLCAERPMHLRDDTVSQQVTAADILGNSHSRQGSFFVVPNENAAAAARRASGGDGTDEM